jgi:hypothetical protein
MANMKSFLEGNGFLLQMKCENPTQILEGACVYIACNRLPAAAYNDDPDNYDWPALRVRTCFYKALKKDSHKDTGVFPLTAPMLAHIFKDLL